MKPMEFFLFELMIVGGLVLLGVGIVCGWWRHIAFGAIIAGGSLCMVVGVLKKKRRKK